MGHLVGETTKNGTVKIHRSIGGTNYEDPIIRFGEEAIPQGHELSLHHSRRLVVMRRTSC